MKVRIQNRDLELDTLEGETLLSAFWRAGVPVLSPCGGKHRCGKCKVKILEGRVLDILGNGSSSAEALPVPENSEILEPGVVQACRTIPETNITLDLIQEQP